MKTGIIVYSQTGNTLEVAEQLMARLKKDGHETELQKILTKEKPEPMTLPELSDSPDLSGYGLVILAAPVMAFSLNSAMKSYLTSCASLVDKRILGFVTQAFAVPWLGGNGAIRKMRKLCRAKYGNFISGKVINWSSSRRQDQIEDLLADFSGFLGKDR